MVPASVVSFHWYIQTVLLIGSTWAGGLSFGPVTIIMGMKLMEHAHSGTVGFRGASIPCLVVINTYIHTYIGM
jgi:hypothetical protein